MNGVCLPFCLPARLPAFLPRLAPSLPLGRVSRSITVGGGGYWVVVNGATVPTSPYPYTNYYWVLAPVFFRHSGLQDSSESVPQGKNIGRGTGYSPFSRISVKSNIKQQRMRKGRHDMWKNCAALRFRYLIIFHGLVSAGRFLAVR